MKNRSLRYICILASIFLYQCQPDSITEFPIEQPIVAGAVIQVEENIISDVTWTAGNTYILKDMIVVTDGATLTIEPCVVVKAENGATGLIVDREAKIDAQGTASCPIIFTSTDDLLEPGEILSPNLTGEDHGLWSGIFLLGQAPVSTFSATNVVSLLPPLGPYTFGGDVPADDSGTLRYVSIRHTGYETAPDETPCGLTLGGVGNSTTIDKIELFANSDDGFVAIGGTVNVDNIVTSHFNDDGYDCDKGYAGTLNNLIGIGGSSGGSSLELDGGEDDDNPSFTIRNASFKGSQSGEDYIDFQNGVNCTIENAYFFGFDADAQVKLDDDEDADNWLSQFIEVRNLEFNTAHLASGNTTIESIFVAAGGNSSDAFTIRPPDASVVTTPTLGADKSVFASWTVAYQTGALADF